MHRRQLLSTLGVGCGLLAGCAQFTGGAAGGPPVVDHGVDRASRNLRIELTVLHNGDPQPDTRVVLHDASGGQRREGTTGPGGHIVFVESVGPPPCNNLRIEFPAVQAVYDVGCYDGGQTLTEQVDIAMV